MPYKDPKAKREYARIYSQKRRVNITPAEHQAALEKRRDLHKAKRGADWGPRTDHLHTPEVVAKRAKAASKTLVGRPAALDKPNAKSEHNMFAKRHYVRSPSGVMHVFINASEFVRQHPEYFDPKDVVWRQPRPPSLAEWCPAAAGLRRISNGSRIQWRGWTGKRDPETLTFIQAIRDAERNAS